MNSWEPVFWMTCVFAVILIQRGHSSARWWMIFGISAGVGLLNKPSMTFFLVALLLALLVTPQRRLLASRWAALGVLLLLAMVTPNLLWQVHNHWPTLEFLRNDRAGNKSIQLGPATFLLQQIILFNPTTALIWIPGLVYLLRRRAGSNEGASGNEIDRRWLGLTYLLFLVLMMALHAKDYYVSPIYPILFAAGGVAWERRFAQRRRVREGRAFAFPVLEDALLILSAIYVLPLRCSLFCRPGAVGPLHARHRTQPLQRQLRGLLERPAAAVLRRSLRLAGGGRSGRARLQVALSRRSSSRVTGILCSNYGQASAINFLGHDLPFAISRHNNYYLWGTHGYNFDSMILIEHTTPEHLHAFYNSVTVVGHMDNPWAVPYERRNTIYLLQGLKVPATTIWNPRERYYF